MMFEVVRLLSFPAIIASAWLFSRKYAESARKLARLLAVLIAVMLVSLVITGSLRPSEPSATTHRWLGHGIVIAAWLSVPFAGAVVLEQHIRHRPVAAITQAFCLLIVLCTAFVASFTGYLGPHHANGLDEATRDRFSVLHFGILTCILAIML